MASLSEEGEMYFYEEVSRTAQWEVPDPWWDHHVMGYVMVSGATRRERGGWE